MRRYFPLGMILVFSAQAAATTVETLANWAMALRGVTIGATTFALTFAYDNSINLADTGAFYFFGDEAVTARPTLAR